MPSAWPRNRPPAALKLSSSAGAKREAGAEKVLPAQLLEEMSAREDVARLRRCARVAPPIVLDFAQALAADRRSRQGTAASFCSGGSACSISALIATLIGSSERWARLKSSMARHNGEAASLSC